MIRRAPEGAALVSGRRRHRSDEMEHTRPEHWNAEFYERLVFLKNVDFLAMPVHRGRFRSGSSPLYPFLER